MKQGDFYVLDKDFKTLMHIDVYYSMIWTDRYNEAGDFELCISPSEEVCKYCVIDNYIWYNNSETLMFIEKIEYKTEFENGPQLIISGRDLKSILARRILLMPEVYNCGFQDAVHNILKRTIIEPLTLWHSEDGWSDQPRTVSGWYTHTDTMREALARRAGYFGGNAHQSKYCRNGADAIVSLGDFYNPKKEEIDGDIYTTFEYLDFGGGNYFTPEQCKDFVENYHGIEDVPEHLRKYYVKEVVMDPDSGSATSTITKIKEDENKKLVEVTEKNWYHAGVNGVESYLVPYTYVVYQQKDPERTIMNFKFEASDDPRITSLTIDEEFSVGTNCLDAISTMCKAVGCGFKVTTEVNEVGETYFIFRLYMGEDRSFNQVKNPYVVFSNANNNLVSMDSKIDQMNDYGNFAYYSAGSDFKDEVSTGEKGLYRKEIHTTVDIEDEEKPEPDPDPEGGETLPESEEQEDWHSPEWKARAKQKAKDILLEKAEAVEGEVKVEPDVNYEFGVDYFVGDIVQTETDWGFNYRLRVTEFITNYAPDGLLMYPTLTEIVDIIDEEEEQ